MSSIAGLGYNHGRHHNGTLLRTSSINTTSNYFNQPVFTATYRTNWSILHTPGPPYTFLTTIVHQLPNDDYYPFWLLIIIAIFGSVTSVLTVLGNILVMLAFFLDRQIRQPTNYFILSLSVSDFLIGLLSMPILTIYIYAKDWPLNAIICDLWLSLDYTVCLTSIYTVLFITIDRFCSVKMPAKYRKWRTKSKINIMIASTWAVPTLIFFTSTMLYPRWYNVSNMQNGVCDVQWNKNHVFNLCLTIAYFWTTLFVMIVLYIFIYDVASKLEKKSQENARKMSSLVGMAGTAITQIGVGIGVNASPQKKIMSPQNFKQDSIRENDENRPQTTNVKTLTAQLSNNSSERRPGNENADDENSNSFESHSDGDIANANDKSSHKRKVKTLSNTIHDAGISWISHSPTSINNVSVNRNSPNQRQNNSKFSPAVKSLAHSIYKNPIRLTGLSPIVKSKSTNKNVSQVNSAQGSSTLSPIPSEQELTGYRINSPPQPRPETLAIMSDELFLERLKARQSPLSVKNETSQLSSSSSIVHPNNINSSSVSTLQAHSNETMNNLKLTPTISDKSEEIKCHDEYLDERNSPFLMTETQLSTEKVIDNHEQTSEDSWLLWNSHNSLDIPYIDETDFEDLGYILHRRCVPSNDDNEPVIEETIVYKSPTFIKHERRSKSYLASPTKTIQDGRVHEIYGNQADAQRVIFESAMFDRVEMITYASTDSNPSSEKLPIRQCSLRHVPREILLKKRSQGSPLPMPTNETQTTSSIIFVTKAKSPLSQTPVTLSPSTTRHINVERALFDFYRCSQINETEDMLTNSDSDALSNYREINQETSSLLRLTEQYTSAFIDEDFNISCQNNLMKIMMMSKTNVETTSDEQTLTNSMSLNNYGQDCSMEKTYRKMNLNEELSKNSWNSSSSSNSSAQEQRMPQHFLTTIEKKRTTSSDSDAVTTTTTTLTTSTICAGSDPLKKSIDSKYSEIVPLINKDNSETLTHDFESSTVLKGMTSKVTFESLMTQTSVPSSPKTKDQGVMAQIDFKDPTNWTDNIHPNNTKRQERESLRPRVSLPQEGIGPSARYSVSNKSSIRDLVQNHKSTRRRKSKTQNRARKALRTITFILGAFVVCWTPWHTYSAIQSLCESCKKNWIFANPMFHCVYFLCYLNSPINPFCYALANQQFKKTFTRILKLDLRRL